MKKSHLRCAVVIPCFNAQAYVETAVRSVLNQNSKPHEIIVVDDGSTDASRAILDTLAPLGVRLLSQKNRGLSGARNAGWRATDAEICIFLDADDFLDESYIAQVLLGFESHPDVEAISPKLKPFGPCLETAVDYSSREDIVFPTPNDFLAERVRLVGSSAFRRTTLEQLGGFSENIKVSEDFDFWRRFFGKNSRVMMCYTAFYNYRRHVGAMSLGKQDLMLRSTLSIIETWMNDVPEVSELRVELKRRHQLITSILAWSDTRRSLKSGQLLAARVSLASVGPEVLSTRKRRWIVKTLKVLLLTK